MRRLASFLVASVLVAVPSCDRTGLHIPASGAGGTMALAGVTAAGGVSAAGGQIGAGGAVSGAGGSGPDTCYSDSDCVRCLWETAPTDSGQCSGSYCCGGMITTKKICEANQAAWTSYCPNQLPTSEDCPCIGCVGQAIACVDGQCLLSCHPFGDAGSDVVVPLGSGGYFGNEGVSGMGGAFLGMGGSSSTGGSNGGSGGSSRTGGASGGVVTCTFGGLLVDEETLSSYTESGITVLAAAGGWQARTGFGNPAPSILFFASAGGAATGQVKVTAGGSVFSFVSIDLYSSVTSIPYVFTGLIGSTKVFSVSGTVPNTFGNFATVANPNAGDLIDTLVIELTDGVAQNPMGLDNIRLRM